MTRRTFTTTVAGLLVASPWSPRRYALSPLPDARRSMLLEAVVGARLPESLALVESEMGDLAGPAVDTRPLPAFFELRTYFSPVLPELLAAGIEPWLASSNAYLIPFESLSHREQVWREATARQAWPAYKFAIYRPLPALRTT